jgi:glycosyltransferase involved in cell wall biosynthesis
MDTAKPKIRLLYVTTLPLAQWWFLRGQNRFLAQKGFELHSITSHEPYFYELAQRDCMTMHPVDIPRSIIPHKDMLTLIRIFFTIRKINPDIVHLSTPKAALLGAIASWAAGIRIRIFLIRGLTSDAKTGFSKKVYQILESLTVRFCNVHYCVSKSLLDQARDNGVLRYDQGEVVGSGMSNGIDCGRFNMANVRQEFDLPDLRESLNIPETSRVVGYVGRLTKDKGVGELLETWKLLRLQFRDIYLLLVGEWRKQEEGDIVSPAVRAALEKDERVRITGYVENPECYYALMTVVVLPSHREGFPNVPMEAAAMELPVVATRVVGCTDAVLDGVTGTLVEPRNPKALANAITKYLSDPALCKEHGQAGRERVEKYFRQEIVWEALLQKYLELIADLGYKFENSGPLRN